MTPDNILDLGRDNVTTAFCGTVPAPGLTTAQAFFAEFLVTSLLILICCGSWDDRNSGKSDSVAIKFGILVSAVDMAEVRDKTKIIYFLFLKSPYRQSHQKTY